MLAIKRLMTRGDQRERAREKNQKKQAGKNKGTKLEDGLTLAQKRERDNEIIRQKQLKKLEEQQQGSASNSKK